MATFLVDSKANTELKNKEGLTPLEVSAKKGQFLVFVFLLQIGLTKQPMDDFVYLLHYSAQVGQMVILNVLLVKHSMDVETKDANGMTPLHISSNYGHFEITRYLLEGKLFLVENIDVIYHSI